MDGKVDDLALLGLPTPSVTVTLIFLHCMFSFSFQIWGAIFSFFLVRMSGVKLSKGVVLDVYIW